MTLHPDAIDLRQMLSMTFWQFRVREVQQTFALALEVLQARYDDADRIVRERWKLGPNDEIPAIEYDDEGPAPPTFIDDVEAIEHVVGLAIDQMRTSALIALYHRFEQLMNNHLRVTDFQMQPSLEALAKMGCTPDEKGLREVRLAANAAKHGRGESAEKLRKRRPDLFNGDELLLSDATLKSFYGTVMEGRSLTNWEAARALKVGRCLCTFPTAPGAHCWRSRSVEFFGRSLVGIRLDR